MNEIALDLDRLVVVNLSDSVSIAKRLLVTIFGTMSISSLEFFTMVYEDSSLSSSLKVFGFLRLALCHREKLKNISSIRDLWYIEMSVSFWSVQAFYPPGMLN